MRRREVLREEFLVPPNLSAGALAKACNLPRTRIERIASETKKGCPRTYLTLTNRIYTYVYTFRKCNNVDCSRLPVWQQPGRAFAEGVSL